VVGGGVAQTATTLYMGLMQRDDIEYSSIHTYNERFAADYVDSGYDAVAVDYANNLDFAFNSYYEGALAVYMWLDGEKLCCYIAQEDAYRTDDGQLVGYAQTPVALSGAQTDNITLAAASIDGYRLKKGERFSFNETVGARSQQRGYQTAENGRGVKVSGGGAAQAAATLYLAVRDAEGVTVTDKHTYGDKFTGNYVANSEDAVLVDYNNNVDFAFTYEGEGELTIRTYVEGNLLVCEVYEK
jgi:vancomycin resistance protein YoaR